MIDHFIEIKRNEQDCIPRGTRPEDFPLPQTSCNDETCSCTDENHPQQNNATFVQICQSESCTCTGRHKYCYNQLTSEERNIIDKKCEEEDKIGTDGTVYVTLEDFYFTQAQRKIPCNYNEIINSQEQKERKKRQLGPEQFFNLGIPFLKNPTTTTTTTVATTTATTTTATTTTTTTTTTKTTTTTAPKTTSTAKYRGTTRIIKSYILPGSYYPKSIRKTTTSPTTTRPPTYRGTTSTSYIWPGSYYNSYQSANRWRPILVN